MAGKSRDTVLTVFGLLAIVGAVARLVFYNGLTNYIASGAIMAFGIVMIWFGSREKERAGKKDGEAYVYGDVEPDERKGKILARGITYRRFLNSKKGKRNAFLNALVLLFIDMFIMSELVGTEDWDFLNLGLLALALFVLLFSLMGLWAYRPSAWEQLDIIYENGISSISTPFLPFSEVEKIGYGTFDSSTEGHLNFIIVFGKGRDWQKCPYLWDVEYKNDYYERATEILKQKCPDVPWVQMEWLEWKKKNKNRKQG